MYINKMLEIGKAKNGFVVSCCVPLKPGKKSSDAGCCSSTSNDKMYLAKNEEELSSVIGKLMPLLDSEYSTDKEFDKAFEEATSKMSEEDD